MFPVANTGFPIRFYFTGPYSHLPGDMCLSICGWISTGSPSWRGLKFFAPLLEYVRYLACRYLIFPWRPVMISGVRRFAETCNGLLVVCLSLAVQDWPPFLPEVCPRSLTGQGRERDQVVSTLDSQFGGPSFRSHSGHLLFFFCCPEFKSLAMLASFQLGFLFLLCSIWIICF